MDLNIKSEVDDEYNPVKSEQTVLNVHGIQASKSN